MTNKQRNVVICAALFFLGVVLTFGVMTFLDNQEKGKSADCGGVHMVDTSEGCLPMSVAVCEAGGGHWKGDRHDTRYGRCEVN